MTAPALPEVPVWVLRLGALRTLPLNFEALFRNPTPEARAELRRLTALRGDVARALDADVAEPSLAALSAFHPHLLGVLRACDGVSVELTGPLAVSWTLPFAARFSSGRSPAVATSLRFERACALLAAGLLRRRRASELLAQAGGDADAAPYKAAAAELCRAAGVFAHCAAQPLAAWGGSLSAPDLAADVHAALADLCLLEAQALTLRKARASGVGSALFAKLALGAAALAAKARARVGGVLAQCAATTGDEPRLQALAAYLAAAEAAFRALAHAALGAECYAQGAPGRAVAHMLAASPPPLSAAAKAALPAEYLALVGATLAEVAKTRDAWQRENDAAFFERVPAESELELPEPVVSSKPLPFAEPEPIVPTITFAASACSLM